VLDLIERRMHEIADGLASGFGAGIDFSFKRNYPPLINHPAQTAVAIDAMRAVVGTDNVDTNVEPTMGAEDFAFMLQEKPGCYVFIGNGDGDHRSHGHGLGPCQLHNGSYDFNDHLLPIGASYWARLVETSLPVATNA
jgi:hippurate hydrolase